MIAPLTRKMNAPTYIPPSPRPARFRKSIASCIAQISCLVEEVMAFLTPLLSGSANKDDTAFQIEIALTEALANAVIHGNGESASKRVYVTCHCSPAGEVTLTVRDQGRGFDLRAVPDPTDGNQLLLKHGRGICLMRALMDEVRFEDNGTFVRMRKRLRSS